MSHLIDRLNFFRAKNVGVFADGHGVTTAENRDWEDAYRKRWQHDKDRALDARGELHGLVLVEDLRQGRDRHLGDPADGLPAHAPGSSRSRAARMLAGPRRYQLVPLLRWTAQVSARSGAARPALA